MNKTISLVVGVVAVVGVVLGGVAYDKANQPVNTAGIFAEKGEKGDKGDKGDRGPVGPAGRDGRNGGTVLGAIPGDSIDSKCFKVNGVSKCYVNQAYFSATNTPISIKPWTLVGSATSTLSSNSVCWFSTSSTTASLVTFGKGANTNATSTILASSTIAANAKATVPIATTTPVADSTNGRATVTDRTFGQSDNLNMSMVVTSGEVGTFSPVGNCAFEFTKVN